MFLVSLLRRDLYFYEDWMDLILKDTDELI